MRTTLATHAILGPAGGSQRLRSSVPRRKPMRYRPGGLSVPRLHQSQK